ncbi:MULTISPECIES: ankyrin repeat domain-containing protein [unclassified Wolbachia]|uniref:ankyrin repeat domain-containing protein n=1 Tax=unclassified Wolbachia TaxID=2640676 RepID=UPI00333F3B47
MLDMNKISKNIKNKINFLWLMITIICVVVTCCYTKSKAVSNYKTVLQIASENCNLEVVKLLVENLLDVNVQVPKLTALHYASEAGCLEVVDFLVQKGADIGASGGYEGWTPLHYAADQGRLEIVKFLLDKGADPIAVAKDGRTPRSMAVISEERNKDKNKQYREVIKLLSNAEGSLKNSK